jgi:NAD+ kinase
MEKNPDFQDIKGKKVLVIFKRSRFSYAMERGSLKEKNSLADLDDPITKELLHAHQRNLKCIDEVKSVLEKLNVDFQVMCRSDISKSDLKNKFIISVGGDGTLLDTSHYCDDSPILGVNSDPISSIGALCAATCLNLLEVLKKIYSGLLKPIPLVRLSIVIDKKKYQHLALNDLLFCHKNPAAMSRFMISHRAITESYRSSGIWVATAAGSTGGIYSSGANPIPIKDCAAIFRLREPYWGNVKKPQLLQGIFYQNEQFQIRSKMSDAKIFIDGPHKMVDIKLGTCISIELSHQPLWLFDGPTLIKNRQNIIKQRKSLRNFF